MPRYDRAIFTILLLALLADVARAAAPVTGVPVDGFMLAAAAQLPAEASGSVLHRARPASPQSRPVSRLSVLSRWPSIFRAAQNSVPVALAALSPALETGSTACSAADSPSIDARPAIFEHTASPAP